MDNIKYQKSIVYLVLQPYDDGLPYSECYGNSEIAICETREIAEQIAKETDEASIINPPFEPDEWNLWTAYMYDEFSDDDGETPFDNYDEKIDPRIARKKELQYCAEFFKTNIKSVSQCSIDEIKTMILKQWEYEDKRQFYTYYPCIINEIPFYKSN